MKSHNDRRKKLSLSLASATVVVAAATVLGVIFFGGKGSEKNYAEDEAKTLESALIQVGAVKNCSRGNTGRMTSSDTPSYYAIFEVPGDRTQATERFVAAAKKAGFSVTPDSSANSMSSFPYADRTSKDSHYPKLESGKVTLLVDIYKASTRTDGDDLFCTVTERNNPPADKTTIRFTINLPPYKH